MRGGVARRRGTGRGRGHGSAGSAGSDGGDGGCRLVELYGRDPADESLIEVRFTIEAKSPSGPFTDAELRALEGKTGGCPLCLSRMMGSLPKHGATGSFLQYFDEDCHRCCENAGNLREQIEHIEAAHSKFPQWFQELRLIYPLWDRYRLKGRPDTAVRLLQLDLGIDDEFFEQYVSGSGMRAPVVAHLFQELVLDALPPSMQGKKPALTILGYTNPERIVTGAVRVDHSDAPIGDGLVWLPHIDLAKLEIVPGWTEKCMQRLRKLNRKLLLSFVLPMPHDELGLRAIYRHALLKLKAPTIIPKPQSSPNHH